MAIAKKCDICGKLYSIYNALNDAKKVNGYMLINIDAQGKYYPHKAMDCCPECMSSIKSHIDSLSKEAEKE